LGEHVYDLGADFLNFDPNEPPTWLRLVIAVVAITLVVAVLSCTFSRIG
jgi:hypothetical protein